MNLKDYLMGLEWNSFSTYPEQGSGIYLHCQSESGGIHKFLKIQRFNAIGFEPRKLTTKFQEKTNWRFSWLPIESINDYHLC